MSEYFKKGFRLLLQSPEIYFATLLLSVLNLTILNLSKFVSLNFLLWTFINVVSYLIYISYSFSIPILFTFKQQKKKITPTLVVDTSAPLLKRLILPMILLVLLFFIALSIFVIVAIQIYGPHKQPPNLFGNIFNSSFPQTFFTTALGTSIVSLLLFIGIYFSIEKFGLFVSIAKSMKLSVKNLPFVSQAFLLLYVSYILDVFIYGKDPITSQSYLLKSFLISPLSAGVYLWVTATVLLYYQSIKRNTSN